MSTVNLLLRCYPESLSEAREALDDLEELDPASRQAAKLVLTELLANAVSHSDLSDQAHVEISINTDGPRIRIDVRDHGTGFTFPEDGSHGGRGLPLVQTLSAAFRHQPQRPHPRLGRNPPPPQPLTNRRTHLSSTATTEESRNKLRRETPSRQGHRRRALSTDRHRIRHSCDLQQPPHRSRIITLNHQAPASLAHLPVQHEQHSQSR